MVSTKLRVGDASQLSVAVGAVKTGVAGQLIVALGSDELSAGAECTIRWSVSHSETDKLTPWSVALTVLLIE